MRVNRRAFLRGSGAATLTSLAGLYGLSRRRRTALRTGDTPPNVLIIVFDTLSARHMSLYGYSRATTPNIERFAGRATIFHNHNAGANFTTPGTATLLTGTYPWTHRAFNHLGSLDRRFTTHNLFTAFGDDYYKTAYSHNALADSILRQMGGVIDEHIAGHSFSVTTGEIGPKLFAADADLASRAIEDLMLLRGGPAGSLYLALADRLRLSRELDNTFQAYRDQFPLGVPGLFKMFFTLEEVVDGIVQTVEQMPSPYLGYFHLLPPHEPYRPQRDFVQLFKDDYRPPIKEARLFSEGVSQEELNRLRWRYDQFLAYADREFGRLLDALSARGLLDDTVVVFTSDHGQLFERGIHGHVTNTLYEPVIHVPLLIALPGQRRRFDVFSPTSAVDLLPTLLAATGRPAAAWTEGVALPLAGVGAGPAEERPIFAVEAKSNPKAAPLAEATVAMRLGAHKLVRYVGYGPAFPQEELYDVRADAEEEHNQSDSKSALRGELSHLLLEKMGDINRSAYATS